MQPEILDRQVLSWKTTAQKTGATRRAADSFHSSLPTGKRDFRVLEWTARPELNTISRQGEQAQLEPRVMEVLVYLAAHAGEVVAKDDLIRAVWNGAIVTDEVLTNAICELRKALHDDARNPRFVQTISKRGYRLIAPVIKADVFQDGNPSEREIQNALRKRNRTRRIILSVSALVLALPVVFNMALLRDLLFGARTARIESIAVLPLHNLSNDPNHEYFAEGMTDAVIANLAKLENLRVISRTSVSRYRETQRPLPEIARELGVDAVLEGSVLLAEGKVRITGQLIRASSDQLIWTETYESDLRDVLALQGDVAKAIAEGIQITLTPGQLARLTETRPVNPQAYEAYLKGRYHFWKLEGPASFEKAIQYFEQAVRIDPTFAPGYVGLADAYASLGAGDRLPPRELFAKAKKAIKRALELDTDSGDAYATLSLIELLYEWDWSSSETAWKKALELSPSGRPAHAARLNYHITMGQFEEALRTQELMIGLESLKPVNSRNYAAIYYLFRRHDESVSYYKKALEFGDDPYLDLGIASNYVLQNKFQEALDYCERAMALRSENDDFVLDAMLAHIYATTGKRDKALEILTHWQNDSGDRYLAPFFMALIHIGLGENDQALNWLELAYEERSPSMTVLALDPCLDPLRSEPRFQALLKQLKFPS